MPSFIGKRRALLRRLNGLPGVSPYDVTDLALGYDMLQPAAATYDGSNRVELLKNFSATANADAAQALNTLKPVYEATGLNGKPCIKADGIDDYMDIAVGFAPLTKNISGFTMIRVGQWVATAGTPILSFISGGTLSTSFRISERVVTGPLLALSTRPIDGSSAENPSMGAPATTPVVATRDNDFLGAKAVRGWDNGVLRTTTGTSAIGPTSNTDSLLARLFASGTPSAYANHRLGAFFFWPRILTDEERQAVELRLGALWNLSITH